MTETDLRLIKLEKKFPHIKVDPTEDLNIDNMYKNLLMKVLTEYKTVKKATEVLGITDVTLRSFRKQYGINKEYVYVKGFRYKQIKYSFNK